MNTKALKALQYQVFTSKGSILQAGMIFTNLDAANEHAALMSLDGLLVVVKPVLDIISQFRDGKSI